MYFFLFGVFTSLRFHGRGGSEKRKVDEIPGEPNYQHTFDAITSTMLTNSKCSFTRTILHLSAPVLIIRNSQNIRSKCQHHIFFTNKPRQPQILIFRLSS